MILRRKPESQVGCLHIYIGNPHRISTTCLLILPLKLIGPQPSHSSLAIAQPITILNSQRHQEQRYAIHTNRNITFMRPTSW